jgi:hypothetical protein
MKLFSSSKCQAKDLNEAIYLLNEKQEPVSVELRSSTENINM